MYRGEDKLESNLLPKYQSRAICLVITSRSKFCVLNNLYCFRKTSGCTYLCKVNAAAVEHQLPHIVVLVGVAARAIIEEVAGQVQSAQPGQLLAEPLRLFPASEEIA